MDKFSALLITFGIAGAIMVIVLMSAFFYDLTYMYPIAAERANNYCKSIGFDQYKEYTRAGLFSKTPIGIKCEFAEKYTDLGVRSNG